MAEENPLTVFVAENERVADAVIALLAKEGIIAEAHMKPMETGSDPLTGTSDATHAGTEFDIRVTDERQLDAAKAEITSALARGTVLNIREKRAARTGTVTATCEDCGKPSEWPASSMGTTESCPYCGSYMDVPDPDDDFSGIDFGDAEEDGEKEGEAKE